MNTDFPIKLNLRIDWSDLDYFRHVNNVAFFRYIQTSRVNYWDSIRLTKHHLDTGIGPLLASSKCEFRKPLFYPGEVTIEAGVDFIKNTSFGIHHRIFNENNELAAEAQDIMVMFDFNRNEKILFPDNFRILIEKIENRKY